METHRFVYCSVCERDVEVAVPGECGPGEEPGLDGADCLDMGAKCSGAVCPILAAARARRLEEEARIHARLSALA